MDSNFFGSICLTDIPRELIKTAGNGKKYLSITVGERRQPDAYGNTHYIRAYVRKDVQIAEGTNLFIGELKPSTPAPTAPVQATAQATANQFQQPVTNSDPDLPF